MDSPDLTSLQAGTPAHSEALSPAGLLLSRGQDVLRARSGPVAAILDLIYPPRCAGCGRVDADLCTECASDLLRVDIAGPLWCTPLPPVRRAIATGLYDGRLKDAILCLKQSWSAELIATLGARLAWALLAAGWTVDLIVPVPLHRARLRERGYNQSWLLARELSAITGIPAVEALTRTRNTPHQVGQQRDDRLTNVHGAFAGQQPLLDGRAVLLIDDVFTTGATLQACAIAALEARAASASSLTLSAAVH